MDYVLPEYCDTCTCTPHADAVYEYTVHSTAVHTQAGVYLCTRTSSSTSQTDLCYLSTKFIPHQFVLNAINACISNIDRALTCAKPSGSVLELRDLTNARAADNNAFLPAQHPLFAKATLIYNRTQSYLVIMGIF